MNQERKPSVGIQLVPEENEDELRQTACILLAHVSAARPNRLLCNAVFMLGIMLFVTACLFLLAFSLRKQENTGSRPIAQTVHAQFLTVAPRELYREINLVGRLDYGDGQIAQVAAPIAGHIVRVSGPATGDRVTEGEVLFGIKSDALRERKEGLFKALKEFESSETNGSVLDTSFTRDPLWDARRELLFLGVFPEQITEIEHSSKEDDQLAVKSRTAGILLETRARTGQEVRQGDLLCRVAQPDPMWVYVNLHVSDLPWVSCGRNVHVKLPASARDPLPALVTVVSPAVDPITQTVRIGVPLPNPEGELQKDMAAIIAIRVGVLTDGTPEPTGLEGKFICPSHPVIVRNVTGNCPIDGLLLARAPTSRSQSKRGKTLAIPVAAVFDRDGRKLVRRLTSDGPIETREIMVGPAAQSVDSRGGESTYYPVRKGLKEGDKVLVGPDRRHRLDNRIASLQR